MDTDEQVKPQLFQTLTRNARPNLNSKLFLTLNAF